MSAFIRLHLLPELDRSPEEDPLVLVGVAQIGLVRGYRSGGSFVFVLGHAQLVAESPTEIAALIGAAENER